MRKIFIALLCMFALIGFVFTAVLIALHFGLLNVKGSASERNKYFTSQSDNQIKSYSIQGSQSPIPLGAWAQSEEWGLLKEVFARDQNIINRASRDSGVPARLILSAVIGEQFRFLSSRREAFKNYFEPLKILPSLSNISYGIAGIKPKTATSIETNLKNPQSVFYLGPQMEHILDYPTGVDTASEQMTRITNSTDAYYSYLYVGLYIRQIQTQWRNAGFPIDNRADILATLYNLGFYYSHPNAMPIAGGAVITINGVDYTYGDLAHDFYMSGELSDIFPGSVQ